MITSDSKLIEQMIQDVVKADSAYIRLDAEDFNLLKSRSSRLQAIRVNVDMCAQDYKLILTEELGKRDEGRVASVAVHIGSPMGDDVLYEQAMGVIDTVNSSVGDCSIIWGCGKRNDGILGSTRIILILGYE